MWNVCSTLVDCCHSSDHPGSCQQFWLVLSKILLSVQNFAVLKIGWKIITWFWRSTESRNRVSTLCTSQTLSFCFHLSLGNAYWYIIWRRNLKIACDNFCRGCVLLSPVEVVYQRVHYWIWLKVEESFMLRHLPQNGFMLSFFIARTKSWSFLEEVFTKDKNWKSEISCY